MALSKFAGIFDALQYYYGGGIGLPPALTVLTGPSVSPIANPGTCVMQSMVAVLDDGSVFYPLATSAPILVGNGPYVEKVTPASVTNSTSAIPGQGSFTATFAELHGAGDSVASATVGLQEAINDAIRLGGGKVSVSSAWVAAGGTQAMINNAVFNSPKTVDILDYRT